MRRKLASVMAAGALGVGGVFATSVPANAEFDPGGAQDDNVLVHYIDNSDVNQMWFNIQASSGFCYLLPEPFGSICSGGSGNAPAAVEEAFVNGCDMIQRTRVTSSGNSWEGADTHYYVLNCGQGTP